eukprot:11543290-Alexandrium_andersonii.AAC.1
MARGRAAPPGPRSPHPRQVPRGPIRGSRAPQPAPRAARWRRTARSPCVTTTPPQLWVSTRRPAMSLATTR